jgi:hypothetical protein
MNSRDAQVNEMRKSFILLFIAAFAGALPRSAAMTNSRKSMIWRHALTVEDDIMASFRFQ